MTKLDKGTVIAAALELLNEVGMDSLTTRKLAERLKVQQPALYWHFQNKRALLDALAEAMLAERHTRSLPEENEDWRVFLKENALSFRTALLSYRDGARIHAGTRPTEPNFGTAETQIRFLCAEGFCPKRAVWALRAVSHYVVGSVLEQQASDADERVSGQARCVRASTVVLPARSVSRVGNRRHGCCVQLQDSTASSLVSSGCVHLQQIRGLCPCAAQLPRHRSALHDAHDLTAELAVDDDSSQTGQGK